MSIVRVCSIRLAVSTESNVLHHRFSKVSMVAYNAAWLSSVNHIGGVDGNG